MEKITIIDNIGWNNDHIAVFADDQRISLKKIDAKSKLEIVNSLKEQFKKHSYSELKCTANHNRFVSVTDFPLSLTEYFKTN